MLIQPWLLPYLQVTNLQASLQSCVTLVYSIQLPLQQKKIFKVVRQEINEWKKVGELLVGGREVGSPLPAQGEELKGRMSHPT